MTSNFKQEAKRTARISRTIEGNLNYLVRDTTEELYRSLTQDPKGSAGVSTGTPRDTRRATNGWNIAEGGTQDYTDRGEGQYNEPPDAKSEARAKVSKGATTASVSNGVPYISQLENGTSKQAPQGFVKRAVNRTVNWLIGYNALDGNYEG